MIHQTTSTVSQPDRIKTLLSRVGAPNVPAMTEELLPFTVRLVRDQDDLSKAVQIRHSAYARHLPDFAETLKSAETADAENGVVVLLAESKLDGSPLGTMRIQTNQFKPLCLEQSVQLPAWLKRRPLAEATRLGVTDGKGGRLVTTVLFKAFFQYCQQTGIEWMVVAGRAPVDRMYDRLMFEDVFPGMGYIPLAHAGNLPHRVMLFDVNTAEDRWAQAKHPLFGFMCHTHHPDINLGGQRRQNVPHMAMSAFPAQGTAFPM
ncbi:hypothetical protein Rfer_2484 [Rhodoferax ferrireducens T118]|uniref:Uncharacterized protein n=1 Tax=Albidiferax ferrireducens (strain ATCC BAA-621 / DSM 15236 / T118) TaxID=338969 RepID=Q21VK2_ALBFT|nr:hypothetical protein [Rhodoferax ferrireducens]ABD70201.1 hypothetical protein Rfer_2484 [Rhodoferax ferrireducens T118]